ncbi:hypothetical protein [Psychromonas sp. SA13A]|uniref:hypothetical protein n=1 Tax=Psychromonas sp. SA13A TaxID=2686346 RepID=UPI001408765A|nr:hypothetical protein [Psychromonas sp. SA13A]
MSDKKKPTEEELQQWLEAVHLSSCCSDPLTTDDIDKKDKTEWEACSLDKKKNDCSQ